MKVAETVCQVRKSEKRPVLSGIRWQDQGRTGQSCVAYRLEEEKEEGGVEATEKKFKKAFKKALERPLKKP